MSYISDGGGREEIPIKIRPKSGDVRKIYRYKTMNLQFALQANMRKIFHYEQNRALTVRELAKLQSYPDDFIFKGTKICNNNKLEIQVLPKWQKQ